MTPRILAVPKHRPNRWADALLCYEVLCKGCGEWWPCDAEFWPVSSPQTRIQYPRSRCLACEAEAQRIRRSLKEAA